MKRKETKEQQLFHQARIKVLRNVPPFVKRRGTSRSPIDISASKGGSTNEIMTIGKIP